MSLYLSPSLSLFPLNIRHYCHMMTWALIFPNTSLMKEFKESPVIKALHQVNCSGWVYSIRSKTQWTSHWCTYNTWSRVESQWPVGVVQFNLPTVLLTGSALRTWLNGVLPGIEVHKPWQGQLSLRWQRNHQTQCEDFLTLHKINDRNQFFEPLKSTFWSVINFAKISLVIQVYLGCFTLTSHLGYSKLNQLHLPSIKGAASCLEV